jgi:predicted nuclease of predicted toxin-antitoxin system
MMKLYLDDDSAQHLLIRLLQNAGHDVIAPADVGMAGRKDPAHFTFAIRDGRVLLTHNYDDFELLHVLVLAAGGHHPGILVVRKDNDPKRDMRPHDIVRAIRNLLAYLLANGLSIADGFHILNHWR